MKSKEFYAWMINDRGVKSKVASDNTSRLKRVEKALSKFFGTSIDLDIEFRKNGCEDVIKLISYEEVIQMPKNINLPRSKMGLAPLKTAVKRYTEFSYSQDQI